MANFNYTPRGPHASATYGFTFTRNTSYRTSYRSTVGGDGAKRYSTTQGFLYGYATTVNNARSPGGPGNKRRGTFTTDNQDQLRVNKETAEEFQDLVTANIAQSIKRPRVSTGRLLKVTGDPQNRVANYDYWGVGIPRYLDNSVAKYWRTIEEGNKRVWKREFIGDPLIGIWGATVTGLMESQTWGSVARSGGPYTSAGRSSGDKFKPFGGATRARIVSGKRRFSVQPVNFARVQHNIEPMDAYVRAWRQIGGANAMLERATWMRGSGVRPGSQYLGRTTNGPRRG